MLHIIEHDWIKFSDKKLRSVYTKCKDNLKNKKMLLI